MKIKIEFLKRNFENDSKHRSMSLILDNKMKTKEYDILLQLSIDVAKVALESREKVEKAYIFMGKGASKTGLRVLKLICKKSSICQETCNVVYKLSEFIKRLPYYKKLKKEDRSEFINANFETCLNLVENLFLITYEMCKMNIDPRGKVVDYMTESANVANDLYFIVAEFNLNCYDVDFLSNVEDLILEITRVSKIVVSSIIASTRGSISILY